MDDLIERIVKRVAELPDRSSPDDWPEAMLVTAHELDFILRDELRSELSSPFTCEALNSGDGTYKP